MAKSIKDINIELTLYQCCIADKTVEYITKELTGQQNIECELNTIITATLLLENLKCPDAIIELQHLTQQQIESNLEKLSDICGCMICKSREDIIDDSFPTVLNVLLEDNNEPILLS